MELSDTRHQTNRDKITDENSGWMKKYDKQHQQRRQQLHKLLGQNIQILFTVDMSTETG